MATPKGFTVLVADRYSVARAGIKAVLARDHCKVVEADNGRDAVKLAMKHRPQLAVLDIPMPELTGLLVAHQIMAGNLGTRIIMLTGERGDRELERALMAIRVHGWLCKQEPIELLRDAVDTIVRKGLTWYDDYARSWLARWASVPGNPKFDMNGLTRREMETSLLVAMSYSYKQVSERLGMSVKTVENHVHTAMTKMRVADRAGMVRMFIETGHLYPSMV